MRAERRLGELLKAAKDSGQISPGHPQKNPAVSEGYSRVKLNEAGIDHKLSSHAQKLAAVPESKFEGMIGEWRGRVEKENGRVMNTNQIGDGAAGPA